jgi:hypothetical protein
MSSHQIDVMVGEGVIEGYARKVTEALDLGIIRERITYPIFTAGA